MTFRLKKSDKAEIKALMDEYMQKRRDKQPVEYPSAGSVCKRPEGYFAGALIEQSGLKGRKIGAAQVSEKHAGFIINVGGATQRDVSELIGLCQKTVFEKTGQSDSAEITVHEGIILESDDKEIRCRLTLEELVCEVIEKQSRKLADTLFCGRIPE